MNEDMKKKTIATLRIIAFSAALLALNACSSDDEAIVIQKNALPQDSVIRITTQVGNLIATRANEAGDTVNNYKGTTLGLYIKPTKATTWTWSESDAYQKYAYQNVKFNASREGNVDKWLPDLSTISTKLDKMLWKGSEEQYEYFAYAPCDTRADAGDSISFDLTGQENLGESADSIKYDLLWKKGTGTASGLLEAGMLPITFDHMLCKVKVNLTLSDEFYQNNTTANPIDSVNITTSAIRGKFNVLTGQFGSTKDSILRFNRTPEIYTTDADRTYTTHDIFYAPGDWKFAVYIYTNDNRSFLYVHNTDYTFKAGKIYTINLKMGKDVIQMGTISSEDWKDDVDFGEDASKLTTE